jgi:dUTP pyrophosphatase
MASLITPLEQRGFICEYQVDNPPYNDPPSFGSKEAACFDIQSSEKVIVLARTFKLVHTGLHLNIPKGFEVQIRSRSGLARKNGIFVLNSPGTIDPDYTGEICVILANISDTDYQIYEGDRIAQARFARLLVDDTANFHFNKVDELRKTERGSNGLGSTGVRIDVK